MRTREGLSMCSGDSTLRRSDVSIRAILNKTLWSLPQTGKIPTREQRVTNPALLDRVSGG